MLLLNQAQLNMVRTQSQKRLQRNQSAEVRPRLRAWLHPAAQTGVKHPLRYLQRGQVLLFFSHATKDLCSAPPCFTADIYPLPIPWMPPILHLSDEGFMGVLYPSCTIASDRIARLNTELLVSSASQWAMEMWKAKNASHIPTAPTTTTAVRYIYSQTKTEKLRLSVVEKNGAGHVYAFGVA